VGVVHDPGEVVAGLADVREGYRFENRPLVAAQCGPHLLQPFGRSQVCPVLRVFAVRALAITALVLKALAVRALASGAEQLAVDRADDVGERDLRGRPGKPESAVRAALAADDVAAPQVDQDRLKELARDVVRLGELLGRDPVFLRRR
jgi:hypothetical protein